MKKKRFVTWLKKQNVLELSRKLECSPQAIYNWRGGHHKPHLSMAYKIVEQSNSKLTIKDIIEA